MWRSGPLPVRSLAQGSPAAEPALRGAETSPVWPWRCCPRAPVAEGWRALARRSIPPPKPSRPSSRTRSGAATRTSRKSSLTGRNDARPNPVPAPDRVRRSPPSRLCNRDHAEPCREVLRNPDHFHGARRIAAGFPSVRSEMASAPERDHHPDCRTVENAPTMLRGRSTTGTSSLGAVVMIGRASAEQTGGPSSPGRIASMTVPTRSTRPRSILRVNSEIWAAAGCSTISGGGGPFRTISSSRRIAIRSPTATRRCSRCSGQKRACPMEEPDAGTNYYRRPRLS